MKAASRLVSTLVLIISLFNQLDSQILINEVCSRNQQSLLDEYGDSPDWVEFYNPADTSVNIQNYMFSDDPMNPSKWIFNSNIIPPKSHLLVLASDKDIHVKEGLYDTINGFSSKYSSWGDELARPGGSHVDPLDYAQILGDNAGTPEYSARIVMVDSAGFGWSFATLFISAHETDSVVDYTGCNSIIIKATIPADKIVRLRVVQDGLESYLGFYQYIIGTGITNDTYQISLYKNVKPLDLTKVMGVQFEGAVIPDTIDINVSSIKWTRSDVIGQMPIANFAYSDSMDQSLPGKSTIYPYEFSDFTGIKNNDIAISATINFADNSGPGELGYSYAGVRMLFYNWDDTLDLSEFSVLRLKGYLELDKNIMIRLYHGETNDWECYGKVITGTGIDNDIYDIPLHGNVDPLQLNAIRGLGFEGIAPYGEVSFTFTDIDFINDNPEGFIHTNFKISSEGETLVLYNSDGLKSDEVSVGVIDIDHSYGRSSDGANEWTYFKSPTPDAPNSGDTFNGYCSDSLIFSIPSGFHTGSQNLTISGSAEIRYTIDGSTPTETSNLYLGNITIDTTTVIKAACFTNNTVPENNFVNTYFIDEDITLPVFSISTNPENFFGWETGIFMDGPNWTAPMPHLGANYWEDWEKPVYVEFYDEDGNLAFEQNAGAKVFGGWSRTNAMKSIRLKAKEEYGTDRFNYKFFNNKNNDSFRQIVLRNSGNDFNMVHFHDAISHMVASKNTEIDYLGYQPAIVFINGQYWGIQNIREKINEYYINDNHGIALDSVQLMDTWGGVLVGKSSADLEAIGDNIVNNDLSIDSNFIKYGSNTVDIENFIDFFAINTFSANWDWPQNNLKFWKPASKEGKIRYIMYDTDITFGKYGLQGPDFNQLQRLMNSSEIGPHAIIFTKFLENIGFRNHFINRSADLMNTTLSKEYLFNVIDSLQAGIYAEMPRHREKWGMDMVYWQEQIDTVKYWIANRHSFAFDQIQNEFGLAGQIDLTLNVSPVGAGVIKLNSIYPEEYPWTGTYYNGVPVSMTIIPNPGYTFDHWEAQNAFAGSDFSTTLTQNFTGDDEITAYFSGTGGTPEIMLTEINYNSAFTYDAGDWFEIYNAGTVDVDLSEWYLMDENDFNEYKFPYGTILGAKERIMLIEDSAKFAQIYDTLTYTPYYISFGLDNSGDQIRLYNYNSNEVINMRYNDKAPWAVEADGEGYTLELYNEFGNLNDPDTWIAGCFQGSPGYAYDPECALSIEEDIIAEEKEVLVYPNPVTDWINIEHSFDEGTIQIFSYTGRLAYTKQIESELESINLQHLPKGMYILRIINSEEEYSMKFVRE